MAEWYDNADTRGYENANYYDSALPYNENLTNENLGKSLAGSVGHMGSGIMNLRRPSHLTQDMGASMYQAPPPPQLNTLDPNWQHQLRMQKLPPRGNIDNSWMSNLKNKFSKFTTPMMALLKSQKNNPEENFGLERFPTRDGRVNYSPQDSLYGNMNVASGFGKGLGAAGQKRIDKIKNTITNLPEQWSNLASSEDEADKAAYAQKLAIHQQRLKNFETQQAGYKADLAAQTGQGGTTIVPPDTGGKGGDGPAKNYQAYTGHKATAGRPAAGPMSGSYGPWSNNKDGGRIGYAGGELVDEDINIQGPGFDVNENMEMAEKTPFEMRIDELMDTGMSWQEAYDIASDEFNQLAEGPEDSFSEEGIASLV
mgnify:CR=1 FL=1